MGQSIIGEDKLVAFAKSLNANAKDIEEIAKQFIAVGKVYGVRGDIAFCQSLCETHYFLYDMGTAVTPDQHNYCGMGVTQKGIKGNSFATVKDGVTAQIQHLLAYASTNPIPNGETKLDPRFDLVTRGIAPHWEDLDNHWAMSDNYGKEIMSIFNRLVVFTPLIQQPQEPTKPVDIVKPVEPTPSQPSTSGDTQTKVSIWQKIIDFIISLFKGGK
jgi:N-acetylmuramoyl-L-alanine amidase